jgi:hypothetical protein
MLNSLANCILKIDQGVRTSHRSEDRAIGEKWLAYLSPVLATSLLSRIDFKAIEGFERLIGHSFLIDPEPFGSFYDDWKNYREQCERQLVAGMTVNERLFALGLDAAFDQFAAAKEWDECRAILRKAYLDHTNIEPIIDSHKKRG